MQSERICKSKFIPYLGTEKPQTGPGKLVGSMCAVAGIFSLILPIPIVVNRDGWMHDSVQSSSLSEILTY